MSHYHDFDILCQIAEGSYGTVYKVRRKLDSTVYVMKKINLELARIREVSILASIDSPFIVRYMDSFLEDNYLFLITEYCEKGDLSVYMEKQMKVPLAECKIWKIAIQILNGLAYLHSMSVIHRDIKSKNIFLTRDYKIKIGDFGISASSKAATMKELRNAGTLAYLAPEVLKNEYWTAKTDIWSFGCVLYELCTYRHPFVGVNEATLAAKIMYDKPAALPGFYSKDLCQIIYYCLTKDPSQRPSAEFVVVQKKAAELGMSIIPVKPEDKSSPKKKVQFGSTELMDSIIIKPKLRLPLRAPKGSVVKSILKKTRKFRELEEENKEDPKNKSVSYSENTHTITLAPSLKPVLTIDNPTTKQLKKTEISRNLSEDTNGHRKNCVAFKTISGTDERIIGPTPIKWNLHLTKTNFANKPVPEGNLAKKRWITNHRLPHHHHYTPSTIQFLSENSTSSENYVSIQVRPGRSQVTDRNHRTFYVSSGRTSSVFGCRAEKKQIGLPAIKPYYG